MLAFGSQCIPVVLGAPMFRNNAYLRKTDATIAVASKAVASKFNSKYMDNGMTTVYTCCIFYSGVFSINIEASYLVNLSSLCSCLISLCIQHTLHIPQAGIELGCIALPKQILKLDNS